MYKWLIRPLFFSIDPEKVHHLALKALKLPGMTAVMKLFYPIPKGKEVEAFGLKFPNPIGLAAGFDKDGKYIEALEALGFGFIEVGTVTPKPQPGNDKPRLFRLPEDKAIINRMGFNNEGVDALVERLKKLGKRSVIIGGNIGKNKVTPNEEALNDYLICFEKLHDYVDYFVVNVSSPNTPGLRALQEKGPLTAILKTLVEANQSKAIQRPILLKIAPDLTDDQLTDIIGIVRDSKIHGLITTNTTIGRNLPGTPKVRVDEIGAGGLSGAPVKDISDHVLSFIHQRAPEIPIIGVGGVFTAQDAKDKLSKGASLVQVYTGFIYEGPGIVSKILRKF
ncbi:MAG: quinone-dependent dihydroorotate dehydrogenase [Saprospiraceae bacterium]|nr:quinone-dependent dihydroorotate dehydrogenase [Saprospiraceae bacterium]